MVAIGDMAHDPFISYDIGDARRAAWSYHEAYPKVGRISTWSRSSRTSFRYSSTGPQLRLEPGQTVSPHGPDRSLTVAEASLSAKFGESGFDAWRVLLGKDALRLPSWWTTLADGCLPHNHHNPVLRATN